MAGVGFVEVVGAVYGAARGPSRWPATLTSAVDRVGALGGLVGWNGFSPDDLWMATVRLHPDLSKLFVARHLSNEHARRSRWVTPGAPELASELRAPAEARRGELHAEVLAPLRG